MKKIILLVFVLILAASALAEIDLTGMTFDELLQLRADVDAAIWASDGWQEVEVMEGVYIIGEDIPEGRWAIKCTNPSGGMYTLYPDKDAYLKGGASYIDLNIFNGGDTVNTLFDNGQYLKLSASTFIFSPMVGADLGFK